MYKVYYPEDKVYGWNESEDSDDKSSGVFGLDVTNYTVYAAYECSEKDLDDDSNDLVDGIVLGCVGIVV